MNNSCHAAAGHLLKHVLEGKPSHEPDIRSSYCLYASASSRYQVVIKTPSSWWMGVHISYRHRDVLTLKMPVTLGQSQQIRGSGQ